jgi:hypothetical protein
MNMGRATTPTWEGNNTNMSIKVRRQCSTPTSEGSSTNATQTIIPM